MARFCGVCKGSGWVGARTDFGHKPGGPCRVCGGSGYDQRWGEKMCRGCSNMIEYRYDWSNVPEYCPSCKSDQYKTCANSHCGGTVRYKKFWDNIPDYCSTCKGWYELPCENTHCRGTNRVHASWTNVSKYCKACKGWYEIPCEECGSPVKAHSDWKNLPKWCDSCKSKGVGRKDWRTKNQDGSERDHPQQNIKDKDTKDHTYYDPRNQRSGKASGNRES